MIGAIDQHPLLQLPSGLRRSCLASAMQHIW